MIAPEYRNQRSLSFLNGFSLDSTKPIQFQPGIVTESTPSELIFRSGVALRNKTHRMQVSNAEFEFSSSTSAVFPHNSTEITTVKDEGIGVSHHDLKIMPKIQDKATNNYLSMMVADLSPDDRMEIFAQVMGIASLRINSDGTVTLDSQDGPILQIDNNGTWIVANELKKNEVEEWEGMNYYKSARETGISFFEYIAGEIQIPEVIEDYTGESHVESSLINDYYLVVGLLLESPRAGDINEKVRRLIAQDNLSDKNLSNIINPYLAIVKSNI